MRAKAGNWSKRPVKTTRRHNRGSKIEDAALRCAFLIELKQRCELLRGSPRVWASVKLTKEASIPRTYKKIVVNLEPTYTCRK